MSSKTLITNSFVKNNPILDLFKWIALALTVLLIFQPVFPEAKVAYPFFFVLIGYSLFDKDLKAAEEKAKKAALLSLTVLILTVALYFILDFIVALVGGELVKFIKGTADVGILSLLYLNNAPVSAPHVWVFVAVTIALGIHYFAVRFSVTKVYPYLAILFILMGLFMCVYANAFPMGSVKNAKYIKNAYFFVLPCLSLGYFTAKFPDVATGKIKYAFLAAGIALLCLQRLEDYIYTTALGVTSPFYLTSVLSAVFLVFFAARVKTSSVPVMEKTFGEYYFIFINAVIVAVAVPLRAIFARRLFVLPAAFIISAALFALVYFIFKKVTEKNCAEN